MSYWRLHHSIGMLLLATSLVFFIMYFHNADLLINQLRIGNEIYKETGEYFEFTETSINGKFIGGYNQQHLVLNKTFTVSITSLLLAFFVLLSLPVSDRKDLMGECEQ